MNILKMQTLMNNNSDNYYWIYKDGNLETTNCKKRKYRMMSSYRKQCHNMPAIKIHTKRVDLG